MIVPRLISRFDTQRKRDGFTDYTEKCPICRVVNQNFLGFTDTEGVEKLAGVVMCCFKCGTMFLSKEFLKRIDIKELQDIALKSEADAPGAQAVTAPESEASEEGEFKCSRCGKVCKSKRGLDIHEGACSE